MTELAIDLWITGVIRAGANEIVVASDRDEFHVGDRLIGRYVARDRARLLIRSVPDELHPSGGSTPKRETWTGTWELHTAAMRPGAYRLTLQLDDAKDGKARSSVTLLIRLGARPEALVAAPSPRSWVRERAWKLTREHDPAACQ